MLWHDLKIDCSDALSPDIDIKLYPKLKPEGLYGPHGQWSEYESQALKRYFCKEWLLETEEKLKCKFDCFMFFVSYPNLNPIHAHVDGFTEPYVGTGVFGLNFVPFGSGDMIWYDVLPGYPSIAERPTEISKADTQYKGFSVSELKETARHDIGKSLTLIRTDVPHAIQTTTEERWCVSLRFRDKSIRTWDDVLNKFNHLV
jgi:hypothetical protein